MDGALFGKLSDAYILVAFNGKLPETVPARTSAARESPFLAARSRARGRAHFDYALYCQNRQRNRAEKGAPSQKDLINFHLSYISANISTVTIANQTTTHTKVQSFLEPSRSRSVASFDRAFLISCLDLLVLSAACDVVSSSFVNVLPY